MYRAYAVVDQGSGVKSLVRVGRVTANYQTALRAVNKFSMGYVDDDSGSPNRVIYSKGMLDAKWEGIKVRAGEANTYPQGHEPTPSNRRRYRDYNQQPALECANG